MPDAMPKLPVTLIQKLTDHSVGNPDEDSNGLMTATDKNRKMMDDFIVEEVGNGKPFIMDTASMTPELVDHAVRRLANYSPAESQSANEQDMRSALAEKGELYVPVNDSELFPLHNRVLTELKNTGRNLLDVGLNPIFEKPEQVRRAVHGVIEKIPDLNIPTDKRIPTDPDELHEYNLGKADDREIAKKQGKKVKELGDTFNLSLPLKAGAHFATDIATDTANTPLGLASLTLPVGVAKKVGSDTLAGVVAKPVGKALTEIPRMAGKLPQRGIGGVVRGTFENTLGKVYPRIMLPTAESADRVYLSYLQNIAGTEEGVGLMKRIQALSPGEQAKVGKLATGGLFKNQKTYDTLIKSVRPGKETLDVAMDVVGTMLQKEGKLKDVGKLRSTRFSGQWLPQLYAEKMIGGIKQTQPPIGLNPARYGRREMGRLKMRGDVMPDNLTPIKDTSVRVGTGVIQENKIINTARLQDDIVKMPEVFRPLNAKNYNTPPMINGRPASEYGWTQIAGKDYESSLWDKMRGGWIEPHMKAELDNIIAPKPIPEGLKTLAKATHNMKTTYVTLNLLTRLRNNVTNWVTQAVAGMPIFRVDLPIRAGKEILTKGKLYQEAKSLGMFSGAEASQFYRQELETVLGKMLKSGNTMEIPFEAVQTLEKRLGQHGIGKVESLANKSYQLDEDLPKMASYIWRRERGDAPLDALKFAVNKGLDYGDTTQFMKTMRSSAVPFATYPAKITPVMIKAIAERPYNLRKVSIALDSWNDAVANEYGWDRGDLEKMKQLQAQNIYEQSSASFPAIAKIRKLFMENAPLVLIPLPGKDGKMKPFYMDATGWLPFGQMMNPNNLSVFGISPFITGLQSIASGKKYFGPLEPGFQYAPDAMNMFSQGHPVGKDIQEAGESSRAVELAKLLGSGLSLPRGAGMLGELINPALRIGFSPSVQRTGEAFLRSQKRKHPGGKAEDALNFAYPVQQFKEGFNPYPSTRAQEMLAPIIGPVKGLHLDLPAVMGARAQEMAEQDIKRNAKFVVKRRK